MWGETAINYYKYGKKEINYLKGRDSKLGREIDRLGMVKRKVETDIFSALISSVVGQQISTAAALTVNKRLKEAAGEIAPESLAQIPVGSIQECGMTMRKAEYIKGIAEAALKGAVDFENLAKLSDKEVIRELTSLRGVGEWTAEMLLIHSLQRPDILSYKDLAIRRGMMRLYDLPDLSRKEWRFYRDRYSPYCTVASIYLWEIAVEA